MNVDHTDFMKKYQKSENIMADIQNIIEESQKEAYRAVNTILTQRNWLIGYRTKSNLYSFYSFYKAYPDIFQTVSGKQRNVESQYYL